MKFPIFGLLVFMCYGAEQIPSLSLPGGKGSPGDSIILTVSLSYNGGTQPAAVQWDLNYSTSDLLLPSDTFFSTGAAASAAAKLVTCSVRTPGNVRCIVSGPNKNSIVDGPLASLRFQVAPSTRSSSTQVSLTKTQGANSTGAVIKISGAIATVAIVQP